MNKIETLEAALNGVDEKLLAEMLEADARVAGHATTEESKDKQRDHQRKWRKLRIGITAAAACLVLVVGVSVFGGGLAGDETKKPQTGDQLSLYINELQEIGAGDLDAQAGDYVEFSRGTGKLDAKRVSGTQRIDAQGDGGQTDTLSEAELEKLQADFTDYTGIAWTDFIDRLPENYELASLYTLYTRVWEKDGPKGDYDILHDYVLVFTIGEDDDPADGLEQNVVRIALSTVGEPLRDYFFGDETELKPSQAGDLTFTVSHWAGDTQREYSDYMITFREGKLSYDVEMRGVTESDMETLIAAFAGIEMEK